MTLERLIALAAVGAAIALMPGAARAQSCPANLAFYPRLSVSGPVTAGYYDHDLGGGDVLMVDQRTGCRIDLALTIGNGAMRACTRGRMVSAAGHLAKTLGAATRDADYSDAAEDPLDPSRPGFCPGYISVACLT